MKWQKMIGKEYRVREMVKSGLKVVVVIPCYKVEAHISEVVESLPDFVSKAILVNDASPDATCNVIDDLAKNHDFVEPIHVKENLGVGGATLIGFQRAIQLGAHIIVKMDGDNQMEPRYLIPMIDPLIRGEADFAKGNRLTSVGHLQQMPWIRLVGNALLSLLARAATGYWNVLDPTNGYVAIRSDVFELLPEKYIDNRYFFEMSMLLALGIAGAVVRDVPMPSKYAGEASSLSVRVALMEFPLKILKGFLRRFWYRKILYSLTIEALLFILGLILFAAGSAFGLYNFLYFGFVARAYASPGTVMFAALPMLAGIQLLLNGLMLDIQSVPTRPLSQRITSVFLKKERKE